jgi:acyl transferase domain-containing protein
MALNAESAHHMQDQLGARLAALAGLGLCASAALAYLLYRDRQHREKLEALVAQERDDVILRVVVSLYGET